LVFLLNLLKLFKRIRDLPSKVVLATPLLLRYLIQYTFISNSMQLLALPPLVINKLREWIYHLFSSDQQAFTVFFSRF